MQKFKAGDTVIILNSKISSVQSVGGEYLPNTEKIRPCIVLDPVANGALLISTPLGMRAIVNPIYLAQNPVETETLIALRRNRTEYRVEKLEQALLGVVATPKLENKEGSLEMSTLEKDNDGEYYFYDFFIEGAAYDIIVRLDENALKNAELFFVGALKEVVYNARDFANALGALCEGGQDTAFLGDNSDDILVATREGVRFNDDGELMMTWEGATNMLKHFSYCRKLIKEAIKID